MVPLVSILIPVYNRENLISRAIDSAINQTYRNIEIVIVDNNSTDSTWEIIKKYEIKDSRIRIFRNEKNIGPVLNWKECFYHSTGTFLKILWSDDWMDESFIERAVPIFDDDTAFVLSGYSITNGSISFSDVNFKKEYDTQEYFNEILLLNRSKFPVSPGCAMFRRSDVLDKFTYSPIPNNDKLNSMNNGAGNDLLLYLDIAVNYKYIRTTGQIDNYFYTHPDSFSVAGKGLIPLYYLWAKLIFLEKNKLYLVANQFKLNLLLSRHDRIINKNIYNSVSYKLDSIKSVKMLFIFFFKKCYYRIMLLCRKWNKN